ncbi:hypothetical protein B0T19DRAFT_473560 [Cercophora scortea]|uniref:Plasmid pRiA4b Orf3-like domain-containing protein n=1 Tax=Cercophora scortea TaxID=314031 RepID=A0AAE0IXI3_9PEZI|nr:hypothetical protein B0T19DRAFT_473560 [Cercophora scortea]
MQNHTNYIIKVRLAPGDITNPPVERTLSCPADAPFYMLHMALQTAFGWATTHSFDFAIVDPDYAPPDYTDIMDIIRDRMAVDQPGGRPASSPREYLIRVVDPVQSQFSGIDRMHEGSRKHPNTVEKPSEKFLLHQLLDDPKYQGHPAAEDVGSHRGWEELKAAYRAVNPTSEQKDKREWFERMAANADLLGLAGDRVNFWDREQVNKDLETMIERFQKMGEQSQSIQDKISAAQAQRGIKPENVFRMDGGAFGRGPMAGR